MATCKALLISQQDLEVNCNLSQSVYSNEVDTRTQLMQLKYIKPLLGKDLYNELLEQIEGNSLTVLNESLIEEIKPALSWLVYSDLVPDTNVKNTASGMTKSVGESFELASNSELASISKRAFGNWQVYERNLIEYLQDNKDSYPLWDDDTCINRGIAGYSISAIGGKQNKRRYLDVHYPTGFGK